MPKYIDGNALQDVFCRNCGGKIDECKIAELCEVRQAIATIPAADVMPVVHGHWILADVYHEDVFVCSVCHADITVQINFNYHPTYKYCPMCGAKMDEVNK